MILKIIANTKTKDFYMYDNIDKISISKPIFISKIEGPGLEGNDDVYLLFKTPTCVCEGNKRCSSCVIGYRVIAKKKDGTEFSLVFDSTMYIMNDEGKTIEKMDCHN